MQRNEQPRPDESPKENHEPGDEQVLVDRKAGNHRVLMLRNVTANVEAKKQGEADESQPATQPEGIPGPLPVAHVVANHARLQRPKLQPIETDVDRSPPVSRADLEITGLASLTR